MQWGARHEGGGERFPADTDWSHVVHRAMSRKCHVPQITRRVFAVLDATLTSDLSRYHVIGKQWSVRGGTLVGWLLISGSLVRVQHPEP